ncbi:MAG: biotin/lipoyl-containing protein, partial [Flavobacteriaceae bacterium]
MAEVINMPRLSDTMEEGTVATWFKKVGDTVNEGDILAEIETDKATMEFEAFYEGELLHIGISEGETAPVDSLLAIIGEKGEDISGLIDGGTSTAPSTQEVVAETEAVQETPVAITAMPDNVEIITMPRLSDTMEEGTVASWLKKVGDMVKEGDILAEIETDKATMEFESFYTGTLLYVGIAEGESAAVDSVLAIIGDKDANVEQALAAVKSAAPTEKAATTPVPEKTPVTETPPTTATVVAPASQSTSNGRVIASPLAKRLAHERGIQLNAVQGTGDGGRIIKRDIENYNTSGHMATHVPQGVESVEE